MNKETLLSIQSDGFVFVGCWCAGRIFLHPEGKPDAVGAYSYVFWFWASGGEKSILHPLEGRHLSFAAFRGKAYRLLRRGS